jgi:hypothetical protein
MPLLEVYERTTERSISVDGAPLPTCTPTDPFGLDHDCVNPNGHQPIPSCGEVVCFHCARIIWS